MESRAKFLGHPIHQMLIPLPLGLLAMAVIFDVLTMVFDSPTFATVSYWMMAAGLISGLLAAPFGLIDWLAIPSRTRAKRIGALHGLGNVVVLALFAASAWMRRDAPSTPQTEALALSFTAVCLALVTAWLGGEMVDRLAVGVDEGANVDAPSSLTIKRVA